ncbi:MAG: ASCH domain-containing protein [Candidatus Nezhaarchaeota archaeon]|nr:ASCH domain-containing protein [Candidatus Nezhaarchaeota archaeon]
MGLRRGVVGRRLTMKGELADLVVKGLKSTTIRLGKLKLKHRVLTLHGGGRDVARVEVTEVRYRKLRDLTDEDARRDGFENLEALLKALRGMYGEVRPDDTVTILGLRVLEVLEPKPRLSAVKIAEEALRANAELTGEERRVLTEVVRRGSIRKAAAALYGDVNRRWLVRRVIKKALKSLALRELLGVEGGEG